MERKSSLFNPHQTIKLFGNKFHQHHHIRVNRFRCIGIITHLFAIAVLPVFEIILLCNIRTRIDRYFFVNSANDYKWHIE